MTELPIISVFESAPDQYYLVATSYSRTMPAGPRLFRAGPHPDVRFTHTTRASAEKDAAILQAYINNPPKRGRSARSEEADVAPAQIRDAVWM